VGHCFVEWISSLTKGEWIVKAMRLWIGVCVAGTLFAAGGRAQPPGPKPGPEHEHLRALVGVWDATVKTAGQESKGRMVYNMDLGGLWLASHFDGAFGDMKFSGRGFDTYDPAKKKYVGVWVDSMSPGVMMMEGELDKDGKVMTMVGEGPGQDGKPTKFRSVTEQKDKDNFVFKLSMVDKDGKDQEMLTIDYKRIHAGVRRFK
jgi:hypothetical protein